MRIYREKAEEICRLLKKFTCCVLRSRPKYVALCGSSISMWNVEVYNV